MESGLGGVEVLDTANRMVGWDTRSCFRSPSVGRVGLGTGHEQFAMERSDIRLNVGVDGRLMEVLSIVSCFGMVHFYLSIKSILAIPVSDLCWESAPA